jgi:hypothetical protein
MEFELTKEELTKIPVVDTETSNDDASEMAGTMRQSIRTGGGAVERAQLPTFRFPLISTLFVLHELTRDPGALQPTSYRKSLSYRL